MDLFCIIARKISKEYFKNVEKSAKFHGKHIRFLLFLDLEILVFTKIVLGPMGS